MQYISKDYNKKYFLQNSLFDKICCPNIKPFQYFVLPILVSCILYLREGIHAGRGRKVKDMIECLKYSQYSEILIGRINRKKLKNVK